ncbi:hypothetical protein F5Y06DRAFT_197679 [Hypoxylon sp. FL0890]|nr:hypothetical protein F5Y06DRAFT_197679 [Hypoxylon sp. FL0890]
MCQASLNLFSSLSFSLYPGGLQRAACRPIYFHQGANCSPLRIGAGVREPPYVYDSCVVGLRLLGSPPDEIAIGPSSLGGVGVFQSAPGVTVSSQSAVLIRSIRRSINLFLRVSQSVAWHSFHDIPESSGWPISTHCFGCCPSVRLGPWNHCLLGG